MNFSCVLDINIFDVFIEFVIILVLDEFPQIEEELHAWGDIYIGKLLAVEVVVEESGHAVFQVLGLSWVQVVDVKQKVQVSGGYKWWACTLLL